MLEKQREVINKIKDNIEHASSIKRNVREILEDEKLIRNFADEVRQRSFPTTAGVDGTRSRIMQLSMDTAAVAAVAVEGLVPPREPRLWPKPHHIVRFFLLEHSPETDVLLRALMFSYELELACSAPHRVVMLDGSFTSILVATGQGLHKREKGPKALAIEIENRISHTLRNFKTVLTSPRIDQIFVAVPKYTERKEVINILKEKGLTDPILDRLDDKSLMTLVLRSQEVVGPLELEAPSSPWHLTGVPDEYANLAEEIVEAMGKIYVIYVRPSPIHPALRIEVSSNVALDRRRRNILIEAILNQTTSPGIFEPYPLYVADMFVKHVHGSLLELREAAISDIAKSGTIELPDFFLSLHDYRSEGRLD